jgi:ubiquinone/menaquinone biosynthesis C-methylase UbiE
MHALSATLSAGTVLDAACGTGRHSAHLATQGHQIIGVDRSPAMLAKVREKLPEGDFREGDLAALPVETGAVDAVVCNLALVHLPERSCPACCDRVGGC